jgi:hypothetical protein
MEIAVFLSRACAAMPPVMGRRGTGSAAGMEDGASALFGQVASYPAAVNSLRIPSGGSDRGVRRYGSRGLRRFIRKAFAEASSVSRTSPHPELAEGSIELKSGEQCGRKRSPARIRRLIYELINLCAFEQFFKARRASCNGHATAVLRGTVPAAAKVKPSGMSLQRSAG